MNQEFLSLIAEADDFTKQVLTENMIKNVMFWGNKAADYVHACNNKLNQAIENDAPEHIVDTLQEKLDVANDKLLLLRKMYKALKA